MPLVNTVLGPVEASTLGFTLSHEHIVCGSPGVVRGWPALYGGRQRLLDTAHAVLTRAIADGVTTIVDATLTFGEAVDTQGPHGGRDLAPGSANAANRVDHLVEPLRSVKAGPGVVRNNVAIAVRRARPHCHGRSLRIAGRVQRGRPAIRGELPGDRAD